MSIERRTKNAEPRKRKQPQPVAVDLRATEPNLPSATAATESPQKTSPLEIDESLLDEDGKLPGETALQRNHRESRMATARRHAVIEELAASQPPTRRNPLFRLPEKERDWLFQTLRECNYDDVVKVKLAKDGVMDVTDGELKEFFTSEANAQVYRRTGRAAIAANALVSFVEENDVEFSKPILQSLGQEAFRQISGEHADLEALKRLTELFLKARADERSERLMGMRREKLDFELRTQMEAALEAFAGEIEKFPEAREAFEALRAELLRGTEEAE